MRDISPLFAERAGCIPFRFEGSRRFVALVTSRQGRRWVIPEGLVEPGEAAACVREPALARLLLSGLPSIR